jgi:hypothetical protein
MYVARTLRIVLSIFSALGFVIAAYFVWLAIADYQMQIREHWKFRCIDVQFMAMFFAFGGAFISAGSFFGFRKTTAWTHRLNGSAEV